MGGQPDDAGGAAYLATHPPSSGNELPVAISAE
jgi:hypothetical protein